MLHASRFFLLLRGQAWRLQLIYWSKVDRLWVDRFVMSFGKNMLVAVVGCALSTAGFAQPATVKLRADQWMPFNGTPDAQKPGYVIDIARAIFVPKGIAVDYATLPWIDTLKAARAGEIDGAIGANVTEGADLIEGAEPIGIPKMALFVRKGHPWKYENIQSLNTIRMGAIIDYSYWDALDAYIKSHNDKNITFFKGENPLTDALEKLSAKEIDVMPETLPVFIWALKSRGLAFADYRIAYLTEGQPIFIAFSKTDQGRRFSTVFEEGIRKLRANGQLAKILSTYGIEDWKD